VRLAKSRAGQLNYATPGAGTANHLVMETFNKLTGVKIVHIPFKGTAQSLVALIGGDIELLVGQIPSTSASDIRPFSRLISSMAQRFASEIRVARARSRSSVSGRSIAANAAGSDLARSSAALSCRGSPPVLRARSAKTSAARP